MPLASPFLPTIAAGEAMVLLHRASTMVSLVPPLMDRVINGSPRILSANGELRHAQLRKGEISMLDIERSGPKETGGNIHLGQVDQIVLERSGELTVIAR